MRSKCLFLVAALVCMSSTAYAQNARATKSVLCVNSQQTVLHRAKGFCRKGEKKINLNRFLVTTKGADGIAGATGAPGANGLNGKDGAPGAVGPMGPTGETGPAGKNGSELFDWSGSTGNAALGTQSKWALHSIGISGSKNTVGVPTSSSCSLVEFSIVMESAPGNGAQREFALAVASPTSFDENQFTNYDLCVIAGNSKSCTGTLSQNIAVGSLLWLDQADPFPSASASKARWSLRCVQN